MAANMTGMRTEGTTVAGVAQKRGGMHGRRVGFSGLLAALMIAVLLGGVAMHNRQTSHPAAPTTPRAATGAETRQFGRTNLPNVAVVETAPVVASKQQKFLDVNSAWLLTATVDAAPSAMTSSQWRFLEVNTVMLPEGPSYPDAEDLTPLPGHRR